MALSETLHDYTAMVDVNNSGLLKSSIEFHYRDYFQANRSSNILAVSHFIADHSLHGTVV